MSTRIWKGTRENSGYYANCKTQCMMGAKQIECVLVLPNCWTKYSKFIKYIKQSFIVTITIKLVVWNGESKSFFSNEFGEYCIWKKLCSLSLEGNSLGQVINTYNILHPKVAISTLDGQMLPLYALDGGFSTKYFLCTIGWDSLMVDLPNLLVTR
jgi:hypothetical protein